MTPVQSGVNRERPVHTCPLASRTWSPWGWGRGHETSGSGGGCARSLCAPAFCQCIALDRSDPAPTWPGDKETSPVGPRLLQLRDLLGNSHRTKWACSLRTQDRGFGVILYSFHQFIHSSLITWQHKQTGIILEQNSCQITRTRLKHNYLQEQCAFPQ